MPLIDRIKAFSLALALALPEPVQRLFAGRRLTRDGQTLATDTQLMLRLQRVVREPGPETLPIPDGRRALLRQTVLAGGRQRVGAVRGLFLGELPGRLYIPTGAAEPGPLLLFLHGGGWIYGDLDSHDAACRFLAERSGVRVLAVDYRLAPEAPFPAAYDDAVAAYRWLVAHPDAVGADPARLAVGGDSAGGNLAGEVALVAAREGLPLALQLLVYPVAEPGARTRSRELFGRGLYLTNRFMDLATDSYLPDPASRVDPRASLLHADLPAGLAPAHVVTAGFDPLRDEGEAYARRLREAGVEVELTRYADQIHGFLNVVGVGRTARAAVAEVAVRLGAALAEGRSTR